ncbi:hypothetical protein HPB47_007335, partial [Ixodes persulcatus]
KRSGCGLCRSKTFRRLLIEHRGDIGFATIIPGCVSASECGRVVTVKCFSGVRPSLSLEHAAPPDMEICG